MAGSSDYPEQVDAFVERQDGVDIIQADDVNDSYAANENIQTFIGALGKAQSWSTDVLEFLANQEAARIEPDTTSQFTIKAGVVIAKNSGQSVRLLGRITSDITVTASNIDTGSLADATFYYVYAVKDSAATTFTIVFSLSDSAPTGATQYEKISWFYNEQSSALNVTSGFMGNIKANGRDVPNKVGIVATADFSDSSTSSFAVLDVFTAKFVSNGRPLLIAFSGQFTMSATDKQAIFATFIDTVESVNGAVYSYGPQGSTIIHVEDVSAGEHTIEIKQKQGSPATSSVASAAGTANSDPTLVVIEL